MSGLLFGRDREELKERMERIIQAETETVKVMKDLIKSITEHKAVMERLCAKL